MVVIMLFVLAVPNTTISAAATPTIPKLTKTSADILEKASLDLNVKNKIKGSAYTWSTSNKKIATVDKKGIVKGVKKGTAVITCSVKAPARTYQLTCKVTIRKTATSVKINNKVTALNLGQAYDLNTTLKPSTSNDLITWTGSNKKIAVPDKNGRFTTLKTGTVKITAKALGGKSDSVTIKVVDKDGTVTTQEELMALLGSGVSLITIKTDAAIDFTIPHGTYKNTALVVDAPNAEVHNNGIFASVTIKNVKTGVTPPPTQTEEKPAATPVPGTGSNTDGNSGSPGSTSDTTPPQVSVAATGLETENGNIQLTEASITLRGSATDNISLKSVSAVNKPVSSEEQVLKVVGTTNFEVTVPLNIGGNVVKITAVDSSNNSNVVEVYIDRLSDAVEFVPTVKTSDVEDYQQIFDSIIDVWTIGDDTDTYDDDFMCVLFTEDSPIVTGIKDTSLSIGDTYIIPQCNQFVTGFAGEICKTEDSDDVHYPTADYEVVYFSTVTLDKLFDGDVRMDFSGGIDNDNPISFILLPDGTEYVPAINRQEEEATIQLFNEPVQNDRARLLSTIPQTLAQTTAQTKFPQPGFQPQELLKAIIPTFSESADGNKKTTDLLVKLNDTVIYDRDGNIETENDQIKVGGKFGIEKLKYTGGIEWHPDLLPWSFDLLPQQIMSKISYKEISELKAKYNASIDTKDFVKAMNNGFNNKREFMGLSIQGVDFSEKVVLATFGIRLSGTPVVGRIKSVSDQSIAVPFDPILLVNIIMDLDGSVEGTLTLTFNKTTDVEKGFNLQKKNFSGAYGSLSNNLGQKSYSMPFDRQLEIFDKDEASFEVKLEGEAKAKLEIGGGLDAGVMIAGIMPADISGVVFYRAEAELNGSASIGTTGVSVDGEAYFAQGVGARLNGDIRLLVKGFNWSGGLEKKFQWERMFFEEGVSSAKVVGTVAASDEDRDNSNNPKLPGVKVTLKRTDAANSTPKTATTDQNGYFEIGNTLEGIYDVTFEKEGYTTYTARNISVSGSKATIDAILDTLYENSITGKIAIADADTNDTNNNPLSGASVSITKITGSDVVVKSTITGNDGRYTISGIPAGLYYVDVSKDDYIAIRQTIMIKQGQINYYNATLECIPNELSGDGYASGLIYDALTGQGVSDLTLTIRAGIGNISDGDIVSTITTVSDGSYGTGLLPAGNYCVQITDNRTLSNENERYLSNSFDIKVLGNKTVTAQNGAVTTSLNANQLRIVLRWGEVPSDLDSHLVGPEAGGGRFHTYYSNKSYYSNGVKMADLDLDDTTSYGPETTTIYTPTDGVYAFYVHNYTDRNDSSGANRLANSGAYVQVFVGASMLPLYTFAVPQGEGTLWKVFEYDSVSSVITPINTMSYESAAASVGLRALRSSDEISDVDLVSSDIRSNPKPIDENTLEEEQQLEDAVTINSAGSNDAGLTSVAAQTDGTPGAQTGADASNAVAWEVNVNNEKEAVGLADITVAAGAVKNLYSDSGFGTEVTGTDTIALAASGATTIYIRVTAQDATTIKYYAVTITRTGSGDTGLTSVAAQMDGTPGAQTGADASNAAVWDVNINNAKATE